MKKLILPFLLLIAFALENVFSIFVPSNLFGENSIAAPHFLFIILLFIVVYYNSTNGILFSLLFGFIVDIVYTELLGMYLFAFPLFAYLVANAMRILQVNLFIVSTLVLVSVGVLEYYVYGFLLLLGRTNLSANVFFTERFLPTLLLNLIFLVIFCFPLRKYILRLLNSVED
ncbi:rod shape-determining protein MreD [Ectobacillus sp. sgz5001026]|uniref:rod shape-determining protein MreD n=1 Tax=Ectobacillus sp. sgz5001026 TaxID=3242473 RepID=UPI0036D343FE